MTVCVITPTVEGRELVLADACSSVANQTVSVDHRVLRDDERRGPGFVRNVLALEAEDAEWLLPLDDDDILDEDCVEVLLDASSGFDVVYPWCRVEGNDGWTPNRRFRPEALLRHNFIPVTALVRRGLWLDVQGMDEGMDQFEDYDFWKRALAFGARFKCVDEVLWTYRVKVAGDSRNDW